MTTGLVALINGFCVTVSAELQVLPSRILLSDTQKTAQLSLIHKGPKATKYRINAVGIKMAEDGTTTIVSDPTKVEDSAVEYFRYSPRQVMIEPGTEQVVRLQLKLPEDPAGAISDGDYQAQLTIEAIDDVMDEAAVRPAANSQEVLSEGPTAISVIVRKGSPELELRLENFKTTHGKDGNLSYSVDVLKNGAATLNADFVVLFKPAVTELATERDGEKKEPKSEVVAQTNGITSFVAKRKVTQNLNRNAFEKGILILEVREPLNDGAKVLSTISIETGPLPVLPIPDRGPSAAP